MRFTPLLSSLLLVAAAAHASIDIEVTTNLVKTARRIDEALSIVCSSPKIATESFCQNKSKFHAAMLDFAEGNTRFDVDTKAIRSYMLDEEGGEEKLVPLVTHEVYVRAGLEDKTTYLGSNALTAMLKKTFIDFRSLSGSLADWSVKKGPQPCQQKCSFITASKKGGQVSLCSECRIVTEQGIMIGEKVGGCKSTTSEKYYLGYYDTEEMRTARHKMTTDFEKSFLAMLEEEASKELTSLRLSAACK